jgi:hypothetical protein
MPRVIRPIEEADTMTVLVVAVLFISGWTVLVLGWLLFVP